jgi:hypothetical protein
MLPGGSTYLEGLLVCRISTERLLRLIRGVTIGPELEKSPGQKRRGARLRIEGCGSG